MKILMGVFILLLLAGCCSTGSHRVSKKPKDGVEAVTDLQGKTTYHNEVYSSTCEKDK